MKKTFFLSIIILGIILFMAGYGDIYLFAFKRNDYDFKYRLKHFLLKGIINFLLGGLIFIAGIIFYRINE